MIARRLTVLALILGCANAFAQSTQQLEAALAKKPDDLKSRTQLAGLYAKENRHDKVIELLNPYTDQLKSDGFLLLAHSYSQKKDYANEVRVLNFQAARDEENYKWQMLLGQAYLKQASEISVNEKRHAELLTQGIQRLRRVMQLNKKYKPAFDLLLSTFINQKSHNEARELLTEGIDKFGKRPELFRELCRLDSQDGFLVQAVEHCSESIKISPNFPDHHVYLTQALHDQKEEQRAEKQIVSAAKKFPQSEFVQWAAGTLFARKKNYPVASRYFETAVKVAPTSARARFGLAQSLFESGQEARALEHYAIACKSDPQTLDAFLMAMGKLKQKGNSDLAQKYTSASNNCR